jgi:hypothetical protein
MDNKWKSTSSIRRAGLSILLGFSISFALAVLIFVFGPPGNWTVIYHLVFLKVGLPLGILLAGVLPSAVKHTYYPSAGFTTGSELLGAFLTWGFFFSSMIYGYLCKRAFAYVKPQNGQASPTWRILQVVTTAILLSGWIFAASGSLLNAYRASYGCGPDYSIPFELMKEMGETAAFGIPILIMVSFYWFSRSGKIGTVVTLLAAVIFATMSAYSAVNDILIGYSPCDRKGDEHSFVLFLFEMFAFILWMLLYSASQLFESRRGRP